MGILTFSKSLTSNYILITKGKKSIFIIKKPGVPHLNQVLLKVSITNNKIHQYYMYFQVTHLKENHLTFAVFLAKTNNPIMRKHQKTQSEVRHRHITVLCPTEKDHHEKTKVE